MRGTVYTPLCGGVGPTPASWWMLALRQHSNSGDGDTMRGCCGNECAQWRHASVSCHGLPWRPLPAHTCHACTCTPTRAVGGHFNHCRCTRQPPGYCNVHAATCIMFTPMHHPPIIRNLSTPTRPWWSQSASGKRRGQCSVCWHSLATESPLVDRVQTKWHVQPGVWERVFPKATRMSAHRWAALDACCTMEQTLHGMAWHKARAKRSHWLRRR